MIGSPHTPGSFQLRTRSRGVFAAAFLLYLLATGLVFGQRRPPSVPGGTVRSPGAPSTSTLNMGEAESEDEGPGSLSLKYSNTPLEIILEEYSEKTGKTILMSPGLPKPSITLRSQGELTLDEYLEAIQTVLGMNKIGLVPYGDKFIKVVPIKNAARGDLDIRQSLDQTLGGDMRGELISQMISLKYIDIAEATKVIEPLRSEFGQINGIERTNSLLVTDTASSIRRIVELLNFVDQPIEAREEAIIRPIRYARAADVKARLEEIIKQAQDQQKARSNIARDKTSGSPAAVRTKVTPGIVRPRVPIRRPGTPSTGTSPDAATLALAEAAERGVIRGEVKIVADKRTNQLIFITRPENMIFFEKIIDVLDVATSPDVEVQVIRLEFATAKDVASMLNDLIGATSKGDDPKATASEGSAEAKTLAEAARARQQAQPKGESKIGELSKDNIKILSDERTNSLIIMASDADQVALRGIVSDMDMMLSQVVIEAVILEIQLGDEFTTGVDWVQRSLTAYRQNSVGQKTPVVSFMGGGGGGSLEPNLGGGSENDNALLGGIGGGLTYYLRLFDLNLETVLQATASDNHSKIISSPVIVTTDNTEASIDVTTTRYFTKGKRQVGTLSGGSPVYEDDVETKDIGLKLTVTPRINKNGFVVMEIKQSIQNITGLQRVNDQDWPIVANRDLNASVAVSSGETIVMGGLVSENADASRSKIPFLGEIPIAGRLFSSKSDTGSRTEMVVFLTPYVLDNDDAIASETARRYETLSSGKFWQRGWSGAREPGGVGTTSQPKEAASLPPARVGDPEVDRFLQQEEDDWRRRTSGR